MLLHQVKLFNTSDKGHYHHTNFSHLLGQATKNVISGAILQMPSCNTTPLIESRVKYWALIQTEANMDGWMDGCALRSVG